MDAIVTRRISGARRIHLSIPTHRTFIQNLKSYWRNHICGGTSGDNQASRTTLLPPEGLLAVRARPHHNEFVPLHMTVFVSREVTCGHIVLITGGGVRINSAVLHEAASNLTRLLRLAGFEDLPPKAEWATCAAGPVVQIKFLPRSMSIHI